MSDQILFVISALDRTGLSYTRARTRPRHLQFLEANKHRLVLAGPYIDDQGCTIGSLYVVRSANEDDARQFIDADPYSSVNLFQSVEIRRWRLGIDNIHE